MGVPTRTLLSPCAASHDDNGHKTSAILLVSSLIQLFVWCTAFCVQSTMHTHYVKQFHRQPFCCILALGISLLPPDFMTAIYVLEGDDAPPPNVARMDDRVKKALRQYHLELRTGIIVSHFLPCLHKDAGGFLTDVEIASIAAKKTGGNLEQVDELIEVLVRKENKDFDYFCDVLERNGCEVWSHKLKVAAGLSKHPQLHHGCRKAIQDGGGGGHLHARLGQCPVTCAMH